jgi:ankyrin repeat protein
MLSYRFQWVFYQLEVLRRCSESTNVRRTLEELPKSLEETYERIRKGIDQANREDAHRLFQCLSTAVRPLQIEELAGVLAFDLSKGGLPKLNEDWLWEDRGEAALSACSQLVSVISNNGSRIVQFSHSSVKEFLMSDRLASSTEDVSRFHILIEPSHATLAQACLGTLLRLDEDTDKKSVKQTPLAQYAGQYWVRHARFGDVVSQIVDVMDCFLDADKPHFAAWARIQFIVDLLSTPEYPWDPFMPHPAAPLYFAVDRGFRGLVERLVVKYPQQINAWGGECGGECGTPLHASALRGRIEVAQLLVVHGADINSRSSCERTPLYIASEEGHLEFAEWLLDSGADMNVHGSHQRAPLHLAATRGRLDLVQMLLNRGAEVQARGGYSPQEPPLFSAVEGGNPDVVRLLLDHGADAHIRDIGNNNALHIAAIHAHLEVAQILLALKLEVNARDASAETPLHRALPVSRKPDFVRLLLDHGADVHIRDGDQSALHLAVGSRNPQVVQMILEQYTELDVRDMEGTTPLLKASYNGNPAVVQLLIDHGADPHARDHCGKTALDKAGTLGVCRMLLELNVSQTCAFLGAASQGDPDQIRLLLNHGASPDVRSESGDTPLHFAAARGRLGAARFLVLELNADVNARDDEGTTPLLASLGWIEGTPEVVQFLLENGADVMVRDNWGKTAYEVARSERKEEILELLSKHAAAAA